MTVFIVPAVNPAAQKNYSKTLTSPIGVERRRKLPMGIHMPDGDIHAWGFPRNGRGVQLQNVMKPGDICLFYTASDKKKGYGWAAKVISVVGETHAAEVSNALWDSADFLPYFLAKPIRIFATTAMMAASLNPGGTYMAIRPQGALRLSNAARAAHAMKTYGGFDEWAIAFVEKHADGVWDTKAMDEYFIPLPPAAVEKRMEVSASLFKPVKTRLRDVTPTPAVSERRLSRRAKEIGDAGEEAVVAHLRATLPEAQRRTISWLAKEGITPGWDIEYEGEDGVRIRVEVKSTTGNTFSSFEITSNEWRAAEEHRARYHLYLVANCLSLEHRLLQVVPDPYAVYAGMLTPSVYRVGG
ncbi:DUF3883 domain-containing protein [Luteibacter aegosomatis]|uniref:DUF3883 domain-containing protein n=1 Tax=Luteibacter aegosomatis TaxID=2911537 RepID=UPI001FFB49FE|nr:DUF3883 domain-containing protein [Luteibacter aegosomatis]UPG86404.1 DUF3883 domain-containing protein [Luteibacter aegosomatis]